MEHSSGLTVSVAMATFNGEAFLGEQLESIRTQTRPADELIVSDDASTDATVRIVERFAEGAHFPVRLLRNDLRVGYGANFDRALRACSGDLVFLSDQDDFWFPEKISAMERAERQAPDALMLFHDSEMALDDLTPTGLTKYGQLEALGLGADSVVQGSSSAVRRELLQMCLPIPHGVPHDTWLEFFASGLRAKAVVHETLQYYRRHEQNVSKRVANRPKKLQRVDRVIGRADRMVSGAFRGSADEELRKVCAAEVCLAELLPSIDPSRADAATEWLDELRLVSPGLRRRGLIRSKPRSRRLPAMASSLRQGTYSDWTDFLKDLLERPSSVADGLPRPE